MKLPKIDVSRIYGDGQYSLCTGDLCQSVAGQKNHEILGQVHRVHVNW